MNAVNELWLIELCSFSKFKVNDCRKLLAKLGPVISRILFMINKFFQNLDLGVLQIPNGQPFPRTTYAKAFLGWRTVRVNTRKSTPGSILTRINYLTMPSKGRSFSQNSREAIFRFLKFSLPLLPVADWPGCQLVRWQVGPDELGLLNHQTILLNITKKIYNYFTKIFIILLCHLSFLKNYLFLMKIKW